MSYVFHHIGKCEKFTLPKGIYKFELWGANGGSINTTTVYGGYSSGIIALPEKQEFYACVGGKGLCNPDESKCLGGFNGGGNGSIAGTTSNYGCGGGGATDVRKDLDSLDSRIIVAGGSGGTTFYYSKILLGGTGGGNEGGIGGDFGSTYLNAPTGGSKDKGGTGGWWKHETEYRTCSGYNGTFGFGGNSSSLYASGSSGGGGGWYGGGGAADAAGGGGGSGYIDNSFFKRVLKNGDEIDLHPQDGNGLLLITIFPQVCTPSLNHHPRLIFIYFLFVLKWIKQNFCIFWR